MRRVLTPIVTLWTLVAVTGCMSTANVGMAPPAPEIQTTHQVERNYVLNRNAQATVGDSFIRIKEYDVFTGSAPYITASAPVVVRSGPYVANIDPGARLQIVGSTVVNGDQYSVVQYGEYAGSSYSIQVGADGHVLQGVLANSLGYWNPSPFGRSSVEPQDIRFQTQYEHPTHSVPSGQNFEIVYTGHDAGALHFQYREYTGDDMARPAFSQELSYPLTTQTVRFRAIEFEILEVTDTGIRFRVTRDGLNRSAQ